MKSEAYIAFKTAAFRRFLGMRLLYTLAIQIMSVSVGYLMYELTDSKLMLGYIGLAEAVPAIGMSLIAGHIADKYNRRYILLAGLALLLMCSLALLGLTLKQQALPKDILIAGIFGVIFCTGVARSFIGPVNFALLPQLIKPEYLGNAIAWNSSTWHVASVTGLGVGGLLYGFAGVQWTFAVMSLLLVFSFTLALGIWPRNSTVVAGHEPAWVRIREGLQFVFGNQLILAAIALDLFAVLFGGVSAILPVFAKDILLVGPEGVGFLRAAMALGAILTSIIIAHRPLRHRAGRVMMICVGLFGLCNIAFGLSTWFGLSLLLIFLSGVVDEVSVFLRASLVQRQTPDHMKGRVSSVNSIFITSSNEIGAFESGLAASLLGTVPSVLFGGGMTLLVVAITWWKSPALRNYHIEE